MTDAAGLRALAEQVERASVDEERATLESVFTALGLYACVFRLLDAGGFLDAAALLVPDGWWVGSVYYSPVMRDWWACLEAMGDGRADSYAATEALARTAAALRARAAMMEAQS